MIRKSVETRDWLSPNEPRTVRAVMKRVVEELTVIDQQVGQLYEEGSRKETGSASSRRTRPSVIKSQSRSAKWTNYSPVDTSLLSNIQKLFSERIEIFGDVEFAKVSILTGVIKIGLKTFLECVRVRTFGRFGLQQIQVDAYYMQQYLWRFVSDEKWVICGRIVVVVGVVSVLDCLVSLREATAFPLARFLLIFLCSWKGRKLVLKRTEKLW